MEGYKMKQPPCKGCNDRNMGCHSTCKKYLDWKNEVDALNKEINKQNKKQTLYYAKTKHTSNVLKGRV